MKSLANIIYLLIIILIATVLPIDKQLLQIDLSRPIVDPNETQIQSILPYVLDYPKTENKITEKIEFSYSLGGNADFSNIPDEYYILVDGEKKFPLLSFDIGSDGKIEISPSDLVEDYPAQHTITLHFNATDELLATYYIQNLSSKSFLPSVYDVPSKKEIFTLYLPNKELSDLVPITLVKNQFSNHWLEIYNTYSASISGLAEAPLLNPANKLSIDTKARVLHVGLTTLHMSKYDDGQLSTLLKGLVDTFSTYRYKPSVSITIPNREFVMPYDKYNTANMVYLPDFNNFDFAFLTPIPATDVDEMLSTLTKKNPLIPRYVELSVETDEKSKLVEIKSTPPLLETISPIYMDAAKSQIAMSVSSFYEGYELKLDGEELLIPKYINYYAEP